jgi:transcriptional regulator with XRE-family HTH domain
LKIDASNIMAKKSPDPTDRHVGSRLRMRRMMLQMSQTKLGDVIGVTFQQVQKYENGTNRIVASRLQRVADTLQVPVTFFFEGAPRTRGGTTKPSRAKFGFDDVNAFLASAHGLALAKAFMAISDRKTRRCIVHLVEEMGGRA